MITIPVRDSRVSPPLKPIGQRVHRGLQYAGAASAPAAILFLLLLSSLNLRTDFISNSLVLALNTLFITVIGLVVAAIAAWSYSKSGNVSLLLLGCASLAFALGGLLSGILLYFSDGANDSVTVYNVAALIASLLHLAGAITVSVRPVKRRKPRMAGLTILYSYIAVLAVVEILAFLADWAMLPVFFVDGEGPTLLRQVVLALSIVFFASAAAMFFRFYFKSHSDLAFWYGLALGMLSIGLWSLYDSTDLANATSWAGRLVQYLGSVYLLMAVLTVRVSPGSRIPLKEALTAFLYEAKENYEALLETATDAIVVIDGEGRILLWNTVTEKMFGYTLHDAMGSSLTELVLRPEDRASLDNEIQKALSDTAIQILNRTFEMNAVRKDGTTFPIEFTASTRETLTGAVATLIIRDVTVRKSVEAAQQLSQQRLNVALQNAPILLSSQDSELRYTWIESFRRDLVPEDLIGKTDTDVFPADQANVLTTLKRHVLEMGEGVRAEIALTSKVGLEYFDLTIEPMRAANGSTSGVYSVGIDVTERKYLLETVKAERARWQATVESMVNAIIVLDKDGRVTFANPAAKELIGDLTRDDLAFSERPAAFGLYQSDGETLYRHEDLPAQRALRQQTEVHDAEMVCRKPDGAYHVLRWNAAPLFDAEGRAAGAVGIGHDITVERQSMLDREDLLRQVQNERDKLQAMVESIVDEVWFADAAANITLLNPGTVNPATGWTGSSGAVSSGALPLTQEEQEVLLRSLRGEVIQNEEQVTVNNETRQVRYRQISAAPINDRSGSIIGAVAIVRDVTEQKRAERQIEELNRDLARRASELQVANRELESFAYSVSHDLRTPLTSIDSFSRLVLADYAQVIPPEGQRYLQLIRGNVEAMDRLIRDLLAFSRAGRQPLKTVTVDMTALVRQVLEELKPLQIGRGIDVAIKDMQPSEGDPALLKQVWVNLLTNAFKFTRRRETAQIEIGCWDTTAGMWQLERGTWKFQAAPNAQYSEPKERAYYVRDNGVGFPVEQADKLFGVFQRLHSEEEYEGTGVGLAIVQRVVSRHGGRVWAVGEEDIGAMFCFALQA